MSIYFRYPFKIGILLFSLTSIHAMQADDERNLNSSQGSGPLSSSSDYDYDELASFFFNPESASDSEREELSDYSSSERDFDVNDNNYLYRGIEPTDRLRDYQERFYEITAGDMQDLILSLKPMLEVNGFAKHERWQLYNMIAYSENAELIVWLLEHSLAGEAKPYLQKFVLESILFKPAYHCHSIINFFKRIAGESKSTINHSDVIPTFEFIMHHSRWSVNIAPLELAWVFIQENYAMPLPIERLLNYLDGYGLIDPGYYPDVLILLEPHKDKSDYCYRVCKLLSMFPMDDMQLIIKTLNSLKEIPHSANEVESLLSLLHKINSFERRFIFETSVKTFPESRVLEVIGKIAYSLENK